MESRLAQGVVWHARSSPVMHSFEYPISYMLVSLDELPNIAQTLRLFSLDSFNVFSINQADYLGWQPGSLKSKVESICKEDDPSFAPGTTLLLTMPKILGYAFIPVSFYFCFDDVGSLGYIILEINNTFSERHIYVCPVKESTMDNGAFAWKFPKEFHVSPFLEMDYLYDFEVRFTEYGLTIKLNLLENQQPVFKTRMKLNFASVNNRTFIRHMVRNAYRITATMPRILLQALVLHYFRRLPVQNKPYPSHENTIRASMYSWVDMCCWQLLKRKLQKLSFGQLSVIFPDGRIENFGQEQAGYKNVRIRINRYRVFREIILKGAIGFGESYTKGDWDGSNIADVIRYFLDNYETLPEEKLSRFSPLRLYERVRHLRKGNNKRNSRNNIQAHYDLSNDFFKLFLDKSLQYSAAYFREPGMSLEQAQQEKLTVLLDKCDIAPDVRVLEIGSGWGSLAMTAATQRSCSVTSLTLSEEQKKYADKLAEKRGLSEVVEFRLQDYRDARGTYDRIVSVEMLEAVGHDHLDTFFNACNTLLDRNGMLVLQVICYPDSHYNAYLRRSDWIQKHIFPGSHLPSLGALVAAAGRNNFVVEQVDNMASHYARTLAEWRDRFEQQHANVQALGFDNSFIRKWRFYLASCEAEFDSRWLSVYQLVLTRPNSNCGLESTQSETRIEKVA